MPQSVELAASVSTRLAALVNVDRTLLKPKGKGPGKPSRHPEPKLCDSVVTGLTDSIS